MKRYALWLIIIALGSCTSIGDSNVLDSDDYSTKEERVEILKQQIQTYSSFENAEFELFNVNGFTNSRLETPGPSSWDYKFAIKVRPEDVDKWMGGWVSFTPQNYDAAWTQEITATRKKDWKTAGDAEYFARKGDNVTMIVYRSQGIIFKRVIEE
ncbi:MAG: hypothetical protein ACFB10_23170 [Salibacteraceae bacterium]